MDVCQFWTYSSSKVISRILSQVYWGHCNHKQSKVFCKSCMFVCDFWHIYELPEPEFWPHPLQQQENSWKYLLRILGVDCHIYWNRDQQSIFGGGGWIKKFVVFRNWPQLLYFMGLMDNCCTFTFEIFPIVFLGSNFFVGILYWHPLEVSSNVPKPLALESWNFLTFDTYLWDIVCTTFY